MSDKLFLPYGIRVLVDAVGEDATLAIWERYAGARIDIPTGRGRAKVFTKLIGPDATERLTAELGGTRFQIPLAKKVVNLWLKRRGISSRRRATLLKVSRRTVQYWDSGRRIPRRPPGDVTEG